MDHKRFLAGQRKAVNGLSVLFVGVVTSMWIAAVLDSMFNMGWGWDRQILWLAPPMALFAVFVRFCAMAIFKFVDRNS